MSEAKPMNVPSVVRGKCRHCGSRFVIVAYGHELPVLEAQHLAETCCPNLPQRPLLLDHEPEVTDEIPF